MRLEKAFVAARGEIFEDGFDSEFSRTLSSAIRAFNDRAVREVERLVRFERNAEIASEAIHVLGLIDDPGTSNSRFDVVLSYLQSPDARIRDAASAGLSDLGDPRAIPALREAIEGEPSSVVREDLVLALEQFK